MKEICKTLTFTKKRKKDKAINNKQLTIEMIGEKKRKKE